MALLITRAFSVRPPKVEKVREKRRVTFDDDIYIDDEAEDLLREYFMNEHADFGLK